MQAAPQGALPKQPALPAQLMAEPLGGQGGSAGPSSSLPQDPQAFLDDKVHFDLDLAHNEPSLTTRQDRGSG